MSNVYCAGCHAAINENSALMVRGGIVYHQRCAPASPRPAAAATRHDPIVAVILAIVAGCLGSMLYNKQPLKAVVSILVAMVVTVMTAGVALFVIYPAAIFDGYLVAKRIQRGEAVSPWQFF